MQEKGRRLHVLLITVVQMYSTVRSGTGIQKPSNTKLLLFSEMKDMLILKKKTVLPTKLHYATKTIFGIWIYQTLLKMAPKESLDLFEQYMIIIVSFDGENH